MATKRVTIPFEIEIPAHWEAVTNRGIFKDYNVRGMDHLQLLSVSQRDGVVLQTEITTKKDTSNDNKANYKHVKVGDIVYNKMRMWQGAVGVSKYEGIVSPAYVILRAIRDDVDPEYFHYQYRTKFYIKQSGIYSYGLCDDMNSLRYEDFKNMNSILPPIDDQKDIVKRIMHYNEAINEFIRKKERYIELLKEYKQSKINELVTKGLDPNVKMKDSGIEWLGQIPEHWGLHRLKFLLVKPLQYGANESGEARKEGSLRYIRITDFSSDNELSDSNPLYLNKEKAANYILNEGDLLLARSGATAGKVFICRSLNEPSCYAGYLIRATSNRDKILPEYLYRFCQSLAYQNWISYTFIKSTIENVSAFKYANLSVLLPSLQEQNEIIEKIEIVDSKYKSLIQIATREISTIRKYRQSLTYELVTGIRKL